MHHVGNPVRFNAPAVDPDSEAKLPGWCARYGLFGVLPHRAVQVTLSPGTGVQIRYTKIGAGWIASEQQITQQQRSIPPGAILQPLRGAGIVTEFLSACPY